MTRQDGLSQWVATVSTHLPALSEPPSDRAGLMELWHGAEQVVRPDQRRRLLGGRFRLQGSDTAPTAAQVVSRRRRQERRPAPNLGCGQLFWAAVDLGVERLAAPRETAGLGHGRDEPGPVIHRVGHQCPSIRGCAVPIAWVVLPGNTPGAWKTHWLTLLSNSTAVCLTIGPVLVLADRGLYAAWLYRQITSLGWHPYLRINAGGLFRPTTQTPSGP